MNRKALGGVTNTAHIQADEDNNDEVYRDDVALPRPAQIVRRYNRIPITDGYIERANNGDSYRHYENTSSTPARASRNRTIETQQHQSLYSRRPHGFYWLFFVGIAFLTMVLGYVSFNAFGSWWQIHQDDGTYGRPRTFQVDAVVGHDDSFQHPSHFIAMNLNRHVLVIEVPGGDVSKSIIYYGPTLLGDGQDLTPVTLTFQDMNGDGRPDMVIHILDQTIVFLNNGSKFTPPSNSVVKREAFPLIWCWESTNGRTPSI